MLVALQQGTNAVKLQKTFTVDLPIETSYLGLRFNVLCPGFMLAGHIIMIIIVIIKIIQSVSNKRASIW